MPDPFKIAGGAQPAQHDKPNLGEMLKRAPSNPLDKVFRDILIEGIKKDFPDAEYGQSRVPKTKSEELVARLRKAKVEAEIKNMLENTGESVELNPSIKQNALPHQPPQSPSTKF